MKRLQWFQTCIAIVISCVGFVPPAKAQSEAELMADASVWVSPSLNPKVVSNDASILYCGYRISPVDGAIVHARTIGEIVSPQCQRAINFHGIRDFPYEYNYESRDLSDGNHVDFLGKTSPILGAFDSEANFYYGEGGTLFKNNEVWLSPIPSSSSVKYVDEVAAQLKILYYATNGYHLLTIDLNTKVVISDRVFNLPANFVASVFYVGKDKSVATNSSGQFVTFRNLDLGIESVAQLPLDI